MRDAQGHCRVVDFHQGAHLLMKSGRRNPVVSGLLVLGTPSHQPWSVPQTGVPHGQSGTFFSNGQIYTGYGMFIDNICVYYE